MSDHLNAERNARNIVNVPPLPGVYGGEVRVYTAADGSGVWLALREPADVSAALVARVSGTEYTGGFIHSTMLFTAENAEKLMQQLGLLVRLVSE